jgi:hypothetical protein
MSDSLHTSADDFGTQFRGGHPDMGVTPILDSNLGGHPDLGTILGGPPATYIAQQQQGHGASIASERAMCL